MRAPESAMPARRLSGRALETVYRIGVIIKGIDGVLELAAGVLLWFAPELFHNILRPMAQSLGASRHPLLVDAGYWAGHLDRELTGGAPIFIIAFLIAHGIVKITLVYCLLREYLWVYPYALGVLGLFAAYQVYALIRSPSPLLIFFTILDFVIIWLVWREWRQLRGRAAAKIPRAVSIAD